MCLFYVHACAHELIKMMAMNISKIQKNTYTLYT